MPSLSELDELGAPDRKQHVAAANRLGAGKHAVGRHARQAFVHEVLVGVAAAERRRIACRGVALARLHEHEAHGRHVVRRWRQVERPVEDPLRPRVAD